jgi:hypothetical protein
MTVFSFSVVETAKMDIENTGWTLDKWRDHRRQLIYAYYVLDTQT